MNIKITLDPGAFMPERAHPEDAGADLRSPKNIILPPYECTKIETGVHMAIPNGYYGRITSRSSMFLNGVNTTGTIDSGYTGSIGVMLNNTTSGCKYISRGDKIAQIIIQPIETPTFEVVDKLDETERGNDGFGSTGR